MMSVMKELIDFGSTGTLMLVALTIATIAIFYFLSTECKKRQPEKLRTVLPKRNFMDGPVKWRTSKPDFTEINRYFMNEKTRNHKENSLEMTVENLVKTWEMEATHKVQAKDWKTIDPEKYCLRANKGKKFNVESLIKLGSYNCLMQGQPLYDANTYTFQSSHETFRGAFRNGFPWEVLDVYSGPPVIAFTWRHWAKWNGPYKGNTPSGKTLEMFGAAVVRVNKKLQIEDMDVFYDPNQILVPLNNFKGSCSVSG